MTQWTQEAMEKRLVRYADLKGLRNAFIDARTPGSDRKENFTIIGPGVSENPAQVVHIPEAHGFNIGAARQPFGCTNSQHSRLPAETFVVHSGKWRFVFGPDMTGNPISPLAGDGVEEDALIGDVDSKDGFKAGPIGGHWDHGFALRRLKLETGDTIPTHSRSG